MEQQAVGILLGAGSLAVGYLFSQLANWSRREVEHLKNVPRYRNFSDLERDLKTAPSGVQSRVLVEGRTARRGDGSSLFSDNAGVEGAAKLVTTTELRRVYNEETGKWEERSETLTNQSISIPFSLVDRSGRRLTMENVHLASGFRSVLQLVWQSKSTPEQRSVGDYAVNVTLSEIPTGSKIKEYMLLYGCQLAALGDAMQFGVGDNQCHIVFYPQEVGSSIRSLISQRELFAQVTKTISVILVVGGISVMVLAVLPLIRQRLRNRQNNNEPLTNY